MTMRYIQKGFFVIKVSGADFSDCLDPKFHVVMEPLKNGNLRLQRKYAPYTKLNASAEISFDLVQKIYKRKVITPQELLQTGLSAVEWHERYLILNFNQNGSSLGENRLYGYEINTALKDLFSERKLLGLPEEKPKKKKWQFWKHDEE